MYITDEQDNIVGHVQEEAQDNDGDSKSVTEDESQTAKRVGPHNSFSSSIIHRRL